MHKDNPNIKGISIVNGEVKVIEKAPDKIVQEKVIPKVIDPICGKEINKNEAYRVVKNNKEYYFCSWECREAFKDVELKEGE